jgi:hypothetical protein
MRKVTRREADAWTALAEQYGFTDAEGDVALGRFDMEATAGGLLIHKITPIPAGLYSEALERKTPPIRFDRTPAGEIILPGRWWQLWFERVQELEELPAAMRRDAGVAATGVVFPDILLPADTDTIVIDAPDWDGRLVAHEALPPGGQIRLTLPGKPQ